MTYEPLDVVVKHNVLTVLDATGWNAREAADVLGVSLKTVYNYVHRWGLTDRLRKPRPIKRSVGAAYTVVV